MLLSPEESCLLVVDVQERLLPAMSSPDNLVNSISLLLKAADLLDVPVLASEQYPKGLGPTVPVLNEWLDLQSTIEKIEFSCAANAVIRDRVVGLGRRQLVICGIEAHVCVLQTAIGFQTDGLPAAEGQVFVVADAVDSRDPANRTLALQRIRQDGVQVVATEMVVFEWLGQAGTPAFKELSNLLK